MKLHLPSCVLSMNPLYQTAEEHETDFTNFLNALMPRQLYNMKPGQEKGNDMTALNTHVIQEAPNSKEL